MTDSKMKLICVIPMAAMLKMLIKRYIASNFQVFKLFLGSFRDITFVYHKDIYYRIRKGPCSLLLRHAPLLCQYQFSIKKSKVVSNNQPNVKKRVDSKRAELYRLPKHAKLY